ncbi:hypothetical protein N665_0133s0005 [Sinapis alba]|nr:hypothetical protein N665_0133s0005 [Sinapis alba]
MPHFQSHAIIVLTAFSLQTILHSPSQSESLAFTKSQVLADFLVEFPTEDKTNKEPNSTWIFHVDGSSSKQGSGISIRLTSPTGEILEQSFRLEFHASNNEAEYEAFVAGLRLAHVRKTNV